jgi:hypothetical protein
VEERRRIESRVERRLEGRLPTVAPGRGPRGVAPGPASPAPPSASGAAASPVAHPPDGTTPARVQLEQLTDQVLRQIDSRFTAYRERLGRVF